MSGSSVESEAPVEKQPVRAEDVEQPIYLGGSAEKAKEGLKGESGRYHLYASLACPWAHKTLIARRLKGLEAAVTCSILDWAMEEAKGWEFSDRGPWCTPDINGCRLMRQVYSLASLGRPDDGYSGKATVPVLWDKSTKKIISTKSADIVRLFNVSFNDVSETEEQRILDLRPANLAAEIDELNSWISADLNHGVYAAGLAETQAAYDEAVAGVFSALDRAELILADKRYLNGSGLTEADLGLFVTLVRFDAVYVGLFKCSRKRVVDYENLWPYVRDVFQVGGVGSTFDMEHIKKHYETSLRKINPSGIVSAVPDIDFRLPHSRHLIGKK